MKKVKNKNQNKKPSETEINNLPHKEFKAIVIRMLTELGKRLVEHSENFNKALENIRKIQSELKNTIINVKNTLEGIRSGLGDIDGCISDLKDRIMKVIQSEQQKEQQFF